MEGSVGYRIRFIEGSRENGIANTKNKYEIDLSKSFLNSFSVLLRKMIDFFPINERRSLVVK
jgi:hypothetical protein